MKINKEFGYYYLYNDTSREYIGPDFEPVNNFFDRLFWPTIEEMHKDVLGYVESLMDAAPGSDDEEKLVELAWIVEEIERQLYGKI